MPTFQNRTKEEERETRKNQIVDAAMDLFSQKEFHEVGMRDIAERIGLSAAAIYRYFPSRDDVFVEALVRHMQAVEELFVAMIQGGSASLEALALRGVDYILENSSVFQMVGHFVISGQIHPGAMARYNEMQRHFLNMLESANRRPDIGIDSRFTTHAIYASIIGTVMIFKNYPGRSPEEIRRHIHRLVRIICTAFSPDQDVSGVDAVVPSPLSREAEPVGSIGGQSRQYDQR